MDDVKKMKEFRREVQSLVNRLSLEKYSNTPDFVIAQYLTESLIAYNRAFLSKENYQNGVEYHSPELYVLD